MFVPISPTLNCTREMTNVQPGFVYPNARHTFITAASVLSIHLYTVNVGHGGCMKHENELYLWHQISFSAHASIIGSSSPFPRGRSPCALWGSRSWWTSCGTAGTPPSAGWGCEWAYVGWASSSGWTTGHTPEKRQRPYLATFAGMWLRLHLKRTRASHTSSRKA